MNKAILNPEVQNFIHENLSEDLSKLILKGSPFPEISIQEIAAQISGLQKARLKLPTWFKTQGIIFPPNINLEQTSSQITAHYKATLVSGKKMADLTGGFGIDSYYFSKNVENLVHCEINEDLSEMANHNFKALGSENIETYKGNGLDLLEASEESFDWIYLDPSRRDDYGGKVFKLKQCTPDVPQHLKLLFEKSNHIMVKTSPLLDLTSGMRELKKVSEIHIISVNNEVKELLWILHKRTLSRTKIISLNFLPNKQQRFEGLFEATTPEIPLEKPGKYLYEPNPAVMKSGLFADLSLQTNTAKLHFNSHLYTSEKWVEFPGRTFKVIQVLPYNKKNLKKEIGSTKANITTRNFPKTVEQIRKEFKVGDGGDRFLFFTTNLENDKIVIFCEKLD